MILSFDATRNVGVIKYDKATYIRSIDTIKTKEALPTYNIPATSMTMLIIQLAALNEVSISLSSASRLDNKSEARDVTFPEDDFRMVS